jgi:hypothetical protein
MFSGIEVDAVELIPTDAGRFVEQRNRPGNELK